MAGVKVTDLTTLGTADANDVMYIVDTTANQSKKIEVQNIYSGMPQLDSGTFDMSPSGLNDCSIGAVNAFYQRVGNIVTCSYLFELTAINGASSVSFNLAPPVGSTFTAQKDAIGVLTLSSPPAADLIQYTIQADTAFYQITFFIDGPAPDFTLTYVAAHVQYEIK